MLQNRVTPCGELFRSKARGTLMGNRGVIHDASQNIVRPFKHKAWITCVLQFKGRHRAIMVPNRWTELFFLDEATAFAAGHRPCAECRREDFVEFKTSWLKGNPEFGFGPRVSIAEIDGVLHSERIDIDKKKISYEERLANLPDGAFILWKELPCLLHGGQIYSWSPDGYNSPVGADGNEVVNVLTPRSMVSAFRAGYRPKYAGAGRFS